MEKITVNAELVLTLNSKREWINALPGALRRLPEWETNRLIWIDRNGNQASMGEDFSAAEDQGTYPIKVYRPLRIAHAIKNG